MQPTTTPVASSYHAHIYFADPEQRERAMAVREQIAARFAVQMGRVHDRLIGPHARPMYQVVFSVALFPELVPWLMLNRQGLAVLVHPDTGRPRADHLHHALWLGEVLPIMHPEQLPEADEREPEPVPNTVPQAAVP